MVVTDLQLTRRKSQVELSARLRPERFTSRPERVWWRFPPEYGEYLRLSGDPFVPALLLPCMARGERLSIEAPVSGQLLGSVPAIQALYRRWYGQIKEVKVEAPTEEGVLAPGPGVGCLFSCGVDSFYSLLKNEKIPAQDTQRITHLIYISGFDIKLKKAELLGRLRAHLEETSLATGKRFVEVSTNLKAIGVKRIAWEKYWGGVLASVGLALGPLLKEFIVPSSYAWHQQKPDGSHPELDPLWSTAETAIVHDGCEATRAEKVVAWIARSGLALEHLHVCWRTRDVFYNCGACEKCLRTMIALYVGTGQKTFPGFAKPLRVEAVAALDLTKSHAARLFAEENLHLLEGQSGFGEELYRALRTALLRGSD